MTRRIIAIGGGGFLMERGPALLDQYFVQTTGVRSPKVCFISTAAGDPEEMLAKVPSGVGIDDGAAVLYRNQAIAEVVSSRTGATAYRVARAHGTIVVTPLPALQLHSKPNRRLQATRIKPRAPEPERSGG